MRTSQNRRCHHMSALRWLAVRNEHRVAVIIPAQPCIVLSPPISARQWQSHMQTRGRGRELHHHAVNNSQHPTPPHFRVVSFPSAAFCFPVLLFGHSLLAASLALPFFSTQLRRLERAKGNFRAQQPRIEGTNREHSRALPLRHYTFLIYFDRVPR